MQITSRTRRFGAIAALTFAGTGILGACDGAEDTYCDTLRQARDAVASQLEQASIDYENADPESIEHDILEREVRGLEALLDAKDAELRNSCDSIGTLPN